MSVKAVGYIKELSTCPNGEAIGRLEKLVGYALADYHQVGMDAYTFPSVESLAAESMMSTRECQRQLASLERKGVIRRVYPERQGKGHKTFYFFCELDEQRAAKHAEKGCQPVTLSSVPNATSMELDFASKGCQKDDKRVTESALLNKSNGNGNKYKNNNSPLPPASQGESLQTNPDRLDSTNGNTIELALERGVSRVMTGCGFSNDRLRKVLRKQLLLEVGFEDGALEMLAQLVEAAALRMIDAWKSFVIQDTNLRVKWSPRNFFGDGHWRDCRGWHWDAAELGRRNNATVGMQ